jgi:uncharacterized protein YecT (DUF1311 family)
MTRTSRRLLLVLFMCATSAQADEDPSLADLDHWMDEADAWCEAHPSPAPRPIGVQSPPEDCDSASSYYGIDRPVDYVAARACAERERIAQAEWGIGGDEVLMMIHANGRGVPRDLVLAQRYACGFGDARAERGLRFGHLRAMAREGDAAAPIDVCDDITSGYMAGACETIADAVADAKRTREYATLTADWTPTQRTRLTELRKAATAFFAEASWGEQDMSGTAHIAMALEAGRALDDAMFARIQAAERGEFPTGDAASAAAADAALNTAYRQTLASYRREEAKPDFFGTVRAETIRDAQRLWVAYRDAWLAFARERYPAVADAAWAALLTRERTDALVALDPGP